MRKIATLNDVQIVLKQILDWQSLRDTKDLDQHKLQIKNLGAATDPNDAVILSQLPVTNAPIIKTPQYYSIPFTSGSKINIGDQVAAFTVGKGREGFPDAVLLYAVNPPTSDDLSLNLVVNNSSINLLQEDIVMPSGTTKLVSSSLFVSPLPKIGFETIIYPVINKVGGASFVTITLVVKRIL